MKSIFPGYFKLTNEEIKELWNSALFTFDANMLLNFYRYSDETRREFYKILTQLKKRIWIPHQAAQEYFNNRLNVISQQEKAYNDTIAALDSMEKEFKNSRQHPFIKESLLTKFSILKKEICDQLNQSKGIHNKRIIEDEILEHIESIFNNKVGDEYDSQKLEDLCKEGELRFSKKIPPGYKDSNKTVGSENNSRIYGDLIVWKQILEKSKEIDKPIIFVLDDRKEDWWEKFNGKTIGPRPELIKEFADYTKHSFYMYQADRFLEFATVYLDHEVDEKAIQEVRALRRKDQINRIRQIEKEENLKSLKYASLEYMKERIHLDKKLNMLENEKNNIQNLVTDYYKNIDEQVDNYNERELIHLKNEHHEVMKRMQEIKNKIIELENSELKLRVRTDNNKE